MAIVTQRGAIWYLYWADPTGKKREHPLKTKSKRLADEYQRVFEYNRAHQELSRATDVELGKLQDGYLEVPARPRKAQAPMPATSCTASSASLQIWASAGSIRPPR